MVRCAAFGCDIDSLTHKRVGLFQFPSDRKRRKLWIDRLQRGETATKKYVPNCHSKLCMKHFEDNQFIIGPKFAEQIGFSSVFRLRLKPDAVPTLFELPGQLPSKERKSAAAISKKRMLNQVKSSVVAMATKVESASRKDLTDTIEEPEFTAVPLPHITTTSSSAVTTTSMITTAALFSNCETVQSSPLPSPPCPLNWLADLTSTVPRLPTVMSTSSEKISPSSTTDLHNKSPVPMDCSQQSSATPANCSKEVQTFAIQTQTPYNLIKRRSIRTQCQRVKMVDKGTQTTTQRLRLPDCGLALNDSLNETILSVGSENNLRDPDWEPMEIDEGSTICDTSDAAKEKKYIVFSSCLDSLMSSCSLCGAVTTTEKTTIGTCLICEITCTRCENKKSWRSQPMSGNMPLGNLVFSAAIMFCGSSPVKLLRALEFAAIQNFSISTYNSIQSAYLAPSVMSVWKKNQSSLVADIQKTDRPLRLAGDMRCCTPGHTAKYGSYSVIDLEASKVLDFQLVQSNEVHNSYAMELEGLKRVLDWLVEIQQLTVTDLVTDRHSSIKKFMREDNPHINHWFDVWHVSKGVYKKLEASGKKKGCQKVKDWARSISNHLYWCAASSGGDGELVQQKWLSILNHVANVHEGHGDKFQQCEHGQLEERDWVKKGFKPHAEIEKVVNGRLLVNDVKRLSPIEQTSALESFHNIVCSFASKSVHYFYNQMEARLALAALHFNENSCRNQGKTKDGQLKWRMSFPKSRRGDAIAKQVKTSATFELGEGWEVNREAVTEGVTFYLKYLGSTLLDELPLGESYGEGISSRAVQRIVDMAKTKNRKLAKVALNVSPSGIKVTGMESKDISLESSIYRISFCTADKTHDKVFAFIARNSINETMECHAYYCARQKVAQAVTLSVSQAFKLAKDIWENSQNQQKTKIKNKKNEQQKQSQSTNSSQTTSNSLIQIHSAPQIDLLLDTHPRLPKPSSEASINRPQQSPTRLDTSSPVDRIGSPQNRQGWQTFDEDTSAPVQFNLDSESLDDCFSQFAETRVKNPASQPAMFQDFSTNLKQEDLDDSVQDYMDGTKSLEAFSRTRSMEDLLNI